MKRKEVNIKIANILKNTKWEYNYGFATNIEHYAKKYPSQRCGQIICNYICPDYRNEIPSSTTIAFLRELFPNNPDPFFEESEVTLKRLERIFDVKPIIRYYNIEDILKLGLNPNIKHFMVDNMNKLVFFDLDGICKTGILIGLECSNYYIIKSNNDIKMLIPINHSVNPLQK